MPSYDTALDSIVLVLYRPQDVVNVAAIIRVMSNFGLRRLRLVEPAAFDPYRILGIAHHTEELVAATERFATLEEALADCHLVLGTTGRPREGERLLLSPRQAVPYMLGWAEANAGGKAALLFGPEQDGLPNEALDRCHGIVRIPTHPMNRSLNLAQAALVVAYELFMAAAGAEAAPSPQACPAPDLASGSEREALFASLEELLRTLYPGTAPERLNRSLARLRTLLMRAQPRAEEAAALTNLLRHATRASRGGPSLP
jgi:TrmH family RNA methyltransferase